MAATRLVSGVLREIWQDAAGQPGGPPQTIVTGIRLTNEQKQRVRATLVIDTVVGPALASASGDVTPEGFLQIRIFNGVGGTSIRWTLDVQLTHSLQQALDRRTPTPDVYIAVVNGFGVGGAGAAQNLAQTYNFGVVAADQTLTVDTAKGGGLLIDGSTAAVTAPCNTLEVRQNAAQFTPMEIGYRGNANTPAWLFFTKARGTFAAPAQIATDDLLGGLNFQGYSAGVWLDMARITAYVGGVGPGPGFLVRTAIDFDAAYDSVVTRAFRISTNGAAGGGTLTCFANGFILPSVDNEGQVGSPVGASWAAMSMYQAYVLGNVRMGGTTVGLGTNHAIAIPNDTVFPAGTPTDKIYVGSQDFTGDSVNFYAALAISAEALVWTEQAAVDYQTGIPIVYNGKNYLLLARDMTPG